MFKKTTPEVQNQVAPVERVTSVLGPGINWSGNLGGKGGIRIEGTFEGDIRIRGLVVMAPEQSSSRLQTAIHGDGTGIALPLDGYGIKAGLRSIANVITDGPP